ncbi:MAG TPA: CoA transferase [Anaerolineales bacterium]|nr:CoA transferase [Anaerolineales bacterium]
MNQKGLSKNGPQAKDKVGAQIEGALTGIRVVEFAVFAAGPMVGKHLAEHGAEVIRVESRARPDGFRLHYPPFKDDRPGLNRGGTFAIFNNDVLSVTINLKHARGLGLAKDVVRKADVVVENFAPGVMERLGLSYDEIRAVNPEIIMLSSCNQGQTGPRASQRGFGSQLTSMSGFTHLTSYGDGHFPSLLYGPYIDFIAVGYGLIAVLAALDFRRRTGKGQHIDLSQYEAGVQFTIPSLLDFQVNNHIQQPQGNRDPKAAPHGVYRCKGEDAWCVITVFTEEEWRSLCEAAEHPEWASDARFNDLAARKENEDDLDEMITAWTGGQTSGQIMEKLQAAGVPAGMVYTIRDLFSCPQLAHREQWRRLEHPEMGPYEYEAPPFLLSETPARIRRSSPCIGEHNDYVLRELLGISEEEITQLEEDGVLT